MNQAIGGLWLQKDRNGRHYMTGNIQGTKVVVFKNDFKKEDKHPDYRVYVKEDRGNEEA